MTHPRSLTCSLTLGALALLSPPSPSGFAREGQNYQAGRDPMETSKREAADWDREREGADAGDPGAQTEVGLHYMKGGRVPQDEAEAVKWFRKAADQNHPEAQFSLGEAYRKGDGVAKDPAEAVKWFRLAADQGWHPAQAVLGQMYMRGEGVTRDDVEALMWFRIAGKEHLGLGAYFDSKVLLARLNKQEVAEAEKRASEFTVRKPEKQEVPPTK